VEIGHEWLDGGKRRGSGEWENVGDVITPEMKLSPSVPNLFRLSRYSIDTMVHQYLPDICKKRNIVSSFEDLHGHRVVIRAP
jgi:hypothetical protein